MTGRIAIFGPVGRALAARLPSGGRASVLIPKYCAFDPSLLVLRSAEGASRRTLQSATAALLHAGSSFETPRCARPSG